MKQTVHLFVFDTLADWETGFAIAGINNPESQMQPKHYQIKTVGLTPEPVTTIGGLKILPFQVKYSAILIFPGGEG